jgi:hypothetical protein
MRTVRRRASFAALAATIGVLTSPSVGRAYSLTTWSWNEPVTLKLVDGRSIEGRYRGVSGRTSNPDTYTERYAKWRHKLGSVAAPALGETLLVTRAAGEPVRGSFRGFGDHALLLGTADSCLCLLLPLDQLTEVRLTSASGPDAAAFTARRHWKSAPALYAVALEGEGTSFAVPVAMVASREMLPRAGANTSGTLVAGVLVTAALLLGAAITAMNSAFSQPMI